VFEGKLIYFASSLLQLPQDPSLPPALTPKQAQPVMKQVNVDKLLSELVTMGILPEVKKEPKKAEPPAASSPESSQSPQQPASVLPSSPSQPVSYSCAYIFVTTDIVCHHKQTRI